MTTRVDVEQIEVTQGERLLAVLLAGFLLIGGLWGYFELDRVFAEHVGVDPITKLSTAQRSTLQRRDSADQQSAAADARVEARHQELADRREAFRTALDAGRHDRALAQAYRRSQRHYDAALTEAAQRETASQQAQVAARPVEAELTRIERAEADTEHGDRVVTVALRLAFVLGLLIAALRLMAWQRRRRSRWALTGYASVGAAGALALVMGVDYIGSWFDPVDFGPLVLSIAGAAVVLVALGALQRHLARRLPGRRVRRGECPFCGFPASHGEHCEGCGRSVLAPCAQCHASRRVGTTHCAACGCT